MKKKKNNGIFIKEGLKNIREVGTICSTSQFVARAMAPKIHAGDKPKIIVELGVGTGGITKEILKHLRPKDCYIGIEANDRFLEVCRDGFCAGDKNISVNFEHGLAQNIQEILKKYEVKEVDEIICTIPLRILPKRDTREILQNIKKSLKNGGAFTFVRYIWAPENKEIYKELSNFSVIDKEIIMRNIPPAEVIRMRKTR